MRERKGFATVVPFAEYLKAKKDFFEKNPNCKVVEEIKNLFLGQVPVPDSRITHIGQTVPQTVLMIAWAVVYEEKVLQAVN